MSLDSCVADVLDGHEDAVGVPEEEGGREAA
jgi:hypothetical protein